MPFFIQMSDQSGVFVYCQGKMENIRTEEVMSDYNKR